LTPLLQAVSIDPIIILPTLTKYLAGGTAVMGLFDDMRRHGLAGPELINESAGWLIHALDVPGIAIMASAGRRVAGVWKPAALGACIGIAVRTISHVFLG
jgi:hypothetical protein